MSVLNGYARRAPYPDGPWTDVIFDDGSVRRVSPKAVRVR